MLVRKCKGTSMSVNCSDVRLCIVRLETQKGDIIWDITRHVLAFMRRMPVVTVWRMDCIVHLRTVHRTCVNLSTTSKRSRRLKPEKLRTSLRVLLRTALKPIDFWMKILFGTVRDSINQLFRSLDLLFRIHCAIQSCSHQRDCVLPQLMFLLNNSGVGYGSAIRNNFPIAPTIRLCTEKECCAVLLAWKKILHLIGNLSSNSFQVNR